MARKTRLWIEAKCVGGSFTIRERAPPAICDAQKAPDVGVISPAWPQRDWGVLNLAAWTVTRPVRNPVGILRHGSIVVPTDTPQPVQFRPRFF